MSKVRFCKDCGDYLGVLSDEEILNIKGKCTECNKFDDPDVPIDEEMEELESEDDYGDRDDYDDFDNITDDYKELDPYF